MTLFLNNYTVMDWHRMGEPVAERRGKQKRNLTAYTYNESTAKEIYRLIKEEYYGLLKELDPERDV